MNKKYKKSWKSLPHIAKLTISNKFWDEPYSLGRIDDHISFTVAKKHHSISDKCMPEVKNKKNIETKENEKQTPQRPNKKKNKYKKKIIFEVD